MVCSWHVSQDMYNWRLKIDGLVQERRNSIANALELRLSCTNPSRFYNMDISKVFNN